MSRLKSLKEADSKPKLAILLGVKPQTLTHIRYRLKPDTQYHEFEISKKSGGTRVIQAPSDKLKLLQSNLSFLLLDCIDEINNSKEKNLKNKISSLSHGFSRKKSIITNAAMHTNKKTC